MMADIEAEDCVHELCVLRSGVTILLQSRLLSLYRSYVGADKLCCSPFWTEIRHNYNNNNKEGKKERKKERKKSDLVIHCVLEKV
jgi:hypothetical protein